MRAARPVLALVAILGIGLASAASAAGGPATLTFADPKGDNVLPGAGHDITAVTFTTSGLGKGKKYVAKNLVLTLTLSAPPTSDGSTLYSIDADLGGCGNFYLNYTPGAALGDTFNYGDCGGDPADPTGSGTSFDAVPEVKGNDIVWTLPMKSLPGSVKAGSIFSGISALTDVVDPATGIFASSSTGGPALYDTAATAGSYKVG